MQDARHLHWDAEALWQQLQLLLPGISVEVVARTDSTNTRLLARARRGDGDERAQAAPDGQAAARTLGAPSRLTDDAPRQAWFGRRTDDLQACLLVAEHQTQGRGRLGREWQSARGASLTFSLALPLAPADWSGLSLAVGLALADALDPPAAQPPRLLLKWPNDLWLEDAPGRGRKLGGILIETLNLVGQRLCVIGVGLNVMPQSDHSLGAASACLQELAPEISAPQALARVAAPLLGAMLRFQDSGFAPLVRAYARRDLLRDRRITTTAPELPAGVAQGVDKDGALLVLHGGQVQRLLSGDVSVRPVADAANAADAALQAGGASC